MHTAIRLVRAAYGNCRSNKAFCTSGAVSKYERSRASRRHRNPGIQNQLKVLDPETHDNLEADDVDFEDFEADFMKSGEAYDKHNRELEERKKLLKLQIIGRKYFKPPKQPNFLTWAEKEQIRYLHGNNPKEWTVEKLSNSFPASVETVKKILKASWSPEDTSRILKHDEHVKSNWKLLQDGKLEVDPELREHLLKFTSRAQVFHKPEMYQIPGPGASNIPRRPHVTEFSNIINSYNSLKQNSSIDSLESQEAHTASVSNYGPATPPTVHSALKVPARLDADTYLIDGNKSTRNKIHETFESYKNKILENLDMDKPVSEVEKMIAMKSVDKQNQLEQIIDQRDPEIIENNTKEKKSTPETTDKFSTLKKYDSSIPSDDQRKKVVFGDHIPPRIKIPKGKWLEGATYKVSDCYYDDDGEFLYRVPGMRN